MQIREDRWLTTIFEYPVFSIHSEQMPERAAETSRPHEVIKDHAGGRTSAMYYAKVDANRIELVRDLSLAGLYVVDVNVTFKIDTGALWVGEGVATKKYEIREIVPADYEETLEIAASCFRYSRFHLDPLVPIAIANRIKREWIKNYINRSRGERLFVAMAEDHPVGFLAVINVETEGARVCVIDLIGVAPRYQGKGVGAALTAFFVRHYREKFGSLQVGTQVANTPSVRLYQKLGFFISKAQYVMHGHFGVHRTAFDR